MEMLHVGFQNFVNPARIIAITKTTSSPSKRVRQAARENGMLIDCTEGKGTHSLVITDTSHVICSRLKPNILAERMGKLKVESNFGMREVGLETSFN